MTFDYKVRKDYRLQAKLPTFSKHEVVNQKGARKTLQFTFLLGKIILQIEYYDHIYNYYT